jgi:hypothetical protein
MQIEGVVVLGIAQDDHLHASGGKVHMEIGLNGPELSKLSSLPVNLKRFMFVDLGPHAKPTSVGSGVAFFMSAGHRNHREWTRAANMFRHW